MKQISIYLSTSLMIVSMTIGLLIGYYISPTYQQTMYIKEEMGLGKADRFVDLRYINKMISHHTAAIMLAQQIEDKTSREEIKSLSTNIQKEEPVLIEELYGWKKDWYRDSKTVSDLETANIGGKDEKTDLRFLNALIAHHEEGIEMTKEIRMKSSRKEVLDNADAVENFLVTTLKTLKDWRDEWYGVN